VKFIFLNILLNYMDNQDREIAINRWFDLRRRTIVQLIYVRNCLFLYVRMSRKKKLSYSINSERERMHEK
jgi:hypothetical protein